MTTIHARQIQLTKTRVRKTKKELYILVFSNIFSPPYYTHVFTPVLQLSPHYHPYIYISFPLHPSFTPSLCCTSLQFPSLHYTSLHFTSLQFFTFLDDFHFTSLPFTTLFNDFPHTLFFFNLPQ